jgi:hypothetical protein
MALFLYSPKINNNYVLYGILFIIFIISYVAMAWYDYYFDCRVLPLRKGEQSWQKYIKPPSHQSEKQDDWICETDKSRKKILIYISHIIFIVPMLVYIAIYKNKVNPIIYPLLGVLAIFTLGYHGMYLIFSSHN